MFGAAAIKSKRSIKEVFLDFADRIRGIQKPKSQHRCSNKVGDNRCRYCSRCSRNECDRRRRLSELFE